jgi:flagellar protein FlaG
MQSGGAPQVIAQPTRSDAEVVSQVASTVIKPSNVDATSQPSREVVAKAAADIQQFVQSMGRNLSFSVDEASGYHVVRVVNPNTGELVRQLPSEELLKIARDFQRLNNVLVSQRA